MKSYTSCPLCTSKIKERWKQVRIWECAACGLNFRNPLPSAEELGNLYMTSWDEPMENLAETGGTHQQLAEEYAINLAHSIGLQDLTDLNILEFGAGKGELLAALIGLGANVYAVEPFGFEYLVDSGYRAYASIDNMPDDIKFDLVISVDVIEHLIEPWKEISRLVQLLANDGWIFISTANIDGLNARIMRSKWREIQKEGHLMLFTAKSLSTLLSHCRINRLRRLSWHVTYSQSFFRNLAHFTLQFLRLDGELRYLGQKAS